MIMEKIQERSNFLKKKEIQLHSWEVLTTIAFKCIFEASDFLL